MKTVIMEQTIPLMCKVQEEVTKLQTEEGFVLKTIPSKNINYLVKEET